jgi:hypothetical protein
MPETPKHPGTASELSPLEQRYWNILGDLVFEDSYALWEAILSPGPALNDLPQEEARGVSSQAVIALIERGWIYLFRLDGLDPNEAFKRQELRLTPEEARHHIARMIASREPLVDIWIAPTELGTTAANDPPTGVRALWGWTT